MRNVDSTILRTLAVALAGTGLVLACSSTDSSGDDPGADGGASSGATSSGTSGTSGASSGEPPKPCEKNDDCPSKICNPTTKLCAAATCSDGVKNQTESDIDCGGSCKKCDQDKSCAAAGDCASGVCTTGKCAAPTNTDGVKNGNETGVDCGGAGNPKCADGQGCAKQTDCTSDYCKAGTCSPIAPADGIKNGTETDVDCGGVGNARCEDTKMCLVDGDCKSDVCAGGVCQAPTPTDGKQNGTETDVDCGGAGNPGCATGKICVADGDCASQGCTYNKVCAAGRSCTGRNGGDTCGFGGDGSVGAAQWESCCTRAPVAPTSGPTAGQTVYLDKYQVTAGRMRAFLSAVNFDVRTFVQNARAAGQIPNIPNQGGANAGKTVLESVWDPYLPVSFGGNTNAGEVADCTQGQTTTATGNVCNPGTQQPGLYTGIKSQLGGIIFKGNDQTSTGCFVGAPGTHAYRFPDGDQDGSTPEVGQDIYDTKSMQCIPYLLAQAFCVWEGGRLELGAEWRAAWAPAAANTMPWAAETTKAPKAIGSGSFFGCRFPTVTDATYPGGCPAMTATQTIEYADYQYSYEYPNLTAVDYIVFISAPGRTRGRGPTGHADIIGNNYGLTSDVGYNADPFVATHGWNASGSWEVHGYATGTVPANGLSRTSNLLNKYGKLGLRCAFPTPNP